MTLRAHLNVIDMAEWRRKRGADEAAVRTVLSAPPGCFVGWRAEPPCASHPAAQALLAGLMQGIGEREKDEAIVDAGLRLGEAAQTGQRGASGRRWLADVVWTILRLGKPRRPS